MDVRQGCVLVLVGSMMMQAVTEINWAYMGDAIPAFITIAAMPFTYSIANGLIGGICLYAVLNTSVWLIEKLSGGRLVPPNKAEKDPGTWRVRGGILPPWMVRLCRGQKDFWRDDPPPITESASDIPGGELTEMSSKDSTRGRTDAATPPNHEKSI